MIQKNPQALQKKDGRLQPLLRGCILLDNKQRLPRGFTLPCKVSIPY